MICTSLVNGDDWRWLEMIIIHYDSLGMSSDQWGQTPTATCGSASAQKATLEAIYCWRLLPSLDFRVTCPMPWVDPNHPVEKIELTGLRRPILGTWNWMGRLKTRTPRAPRAPRAPKSQEMRAERKAEREARLKMFRRPRDQIVTKWSGTLSHCHEHLRLIKWGHIWFWHGMCDLFVFSLEIGWCLCLCCCVVLRCWNLSGIAYRRDRHDSRVNIVPVGVQRRGPPNGPGFAESAPLNGQRAKFQGTRICVDHFFAGSKALSPHQSFWRVAMHWCTERTEPGSLRISDSGCRT